MQRFSALQKVLTIFLICVSVLYADRTARAFLPAFVGLGALAAGSGAATSGALGASTALTVTAIGHGLVGAAITAIAYKTLRPSTAPQNPQQPVPEQVTIVVTALPAATAGLPEIQSAPLNSRQADPNIWVNPSLPALATHISNVDSPSLHAEYVKWYTRNFTDGKTYVSLGLCQNNRCGSTLNPTSTVRTYQFCSSDKVTQEGTCTGGGTAYNLKPNLSYQSCPEGYKFEVTTSMCLKEASAYPSLHDSICAVSWDGNGCPFRNPFDPDCAIPEVEAMISTTCGNATTPPTVRIADPATGKVYEASRPVVPGQGAPPGSFNITERTPNPTAGTTEEKTTTTAPPLNPTGTGAGAYPVGQGSGQTTYPGTGTGVGSTPIGQIAVSNFPTSISVNNWPPGLTQPISVNPVVNVEGIEFPDKIKIDDEGQTGELPTGDPSVPLDNDFLAPLKAKLNPFSNFTVPAHAASCPSIDIHWNAWGMKVDYVDNTMCKTLERGDVKGLLQGALLLLYTLIAVRIVLDA